MCHIRQALHSCAQFLMFRRQLGEAALYLGFD
jgi:hypothetical protein